MRAAADIVHVGIAHPILGDARVYVDEVLLPDAMLACSVGCNVGNAGRCWFRRSRWRLASLPTRSDVGMARTSDHRVQHRTPVQMYAPLARALASTYATDGQLGSGLQSKRRSPCMPTLLALAPA
jgi:hypothetical protein